MHILENLPTTLLVLFTRLFRFVHNVAEVEPVGGQFEVHPTFPAKTNVHFVEVLAPDHLVMKVWERGAGPTLACGTGAAAVTVAGVLTGRSDGMLLNHLTGGDLEMEWDGKGDVFMTGPAAEVFSGEYILR